jgi:methyl-accepting chemotaxis protein
VRTDVASSRAGRSPGWFANRPVSLKIASSVLVVAVVAVAVGVTALVRMAGMAQDERTIYSQNLVPIADLGQVQHSLSEAKQDLSQYVLNSGAPGGRRWDHACLPLRPLGGRRPE